MLEQDSEFSDKYRYSDKLIQWFKKAIDNKNLIPNYQPLLRIPLPDQQTSFIAQFEWPLSHKQIPFKGIKQLAKMSGQSLALDQQLITRSALPALQNIHQKKQVESRIFVSQSIESLQKEDYIDWLEKQFNIETTLSPAGLVIGFRLNDIAKNVKLAKRQINALHQFGVETLIEGFTHHSIAAKLLFAMRSAYVKISGTEYNSGDIVVDAIIRQCKKRKAKIILADIEDGATINLQWSAGVNFIGGPYVQPELPNTDYIFPASIV